MTQLAARTIPDKLKQIAFCESKFFEYGTFVWYSLKGSCRTQLHCAYLSLRIVVARMRIMA